MQIIDINPSDCIKFSIPSVLKKTFTTKNLTLRSAGIIILPTHKYQISVYPSEYILQAFEEKTVTVTFNFSQDFRNSSSSKLRLYIKQLFDDSPIEELKKIILLEEGNLMVHQLILNYQIDSNYLTSTNRTNQHHSSCYQFFVRKLTPETATPEIIKKNLLGFCETLGTIQAIYAFGEEHIIQYAAVSQDLCEFYEQRHDGNLYVFAIGRLVSYGRKVTVNDLIVLQNNAIKKTVPNITQKVKIVKNPKEELLIQQHPIEHPIEHHQYLKPQSKADEKISKLQMFKQSFAVNPSVKSTKRRNKSQQKRNVYDEQEEYQAIQQQQLTMQMLSFRDAKNYENKVIKHQRKETKVEITSLIFSMKYNQGTIYLILLNCLMCFNVNNLSEKITVFFEPIDQLNPNKPNSIEVIKDEVIFGHDSYLYWFDLKKKSSDWKYVQRKQIYTLTCIPQLNLLVVGGRNFSKLSYLGKSTSRTNIKFYSCGSADKHNHLSTYDLPDNQGGIVTNMVYIESAKTKILIVLTHNHQMYFLRVKGYNNVEVYSQIHINDIGIQTIEQLQWSPQCGLICLQEIEGRHCLKKIKVKCQYQKIQLSTQSVKVPLNKYIFFTLSGTDKQNKEKEENPGYIVLTQANSDVLIVKKEGSDFLQVKQFQANIRGAWITEDSKFIMTYGKKTLKVSQFSKNG